MIVLVLKWEKMSDQRQNRTIEEILFCRYLSGEASEHEIRQLEQLAGSSAALRERVAGSGKVLKQIEALKLMKGVDTSSAWLKLKRKLSRHSAKNGWFHYWQKIAAVLLLPILALNVFQFVTHQSQRVDAPAELVMNEIKTSSGLRSTFSLPDGTVVWLNGDTKIRYPVHFQENERRIQLEGEAYFEVTPDRQRPFIVDLGSLRVQALGTAFNCMAYPGEDLVETALTEGKVKVTRVLEGVEKGEYTLDPGQVITYKLNSGKFFLEEGNIDKHVAWRSGKFVFRNDPLEVVCQKLGRWFNAEIVIKDESLKDYAFTGTFREEGLNDILELIGLTSPISYKITERKTDGINEYGTSKVEIMEK